MVSNNKTYIRPQLCKEFGINERTLVSLETRDLLTLDWQNRHGLQVTSLSKEQAELLSCARNNTFCFSGGKQVTVPFLRFLFLRFFQQPLEYIVQEMEDRNIWRADEKYLTDLREWFITRLPIPLQELAKAFKMPETDEEQRLFDHVLAICEIDLAYAHPEFVQSFDFMSDYRLKQVVDAALVTRGSYTEVAAFLLETLDFKIAAEGLAFYAHMFLDLDLVNQTDFTAWFGGLKPSAREEIKLAQGQALDTYRVKSGLDDEISSTAVLSLAMDKAKSEIVRSARYYDDQTSPAFLNAIKAFVVLSDRKEKLTGASSSRTVPAFMGTLRLKPADGEHGQLRFPDLDEEDSEEHKTG